MTVKTREKIHKTLRAIIRVCEDLEKEGRKQISADELAILVEKYWELDEPIKVSSVKSAINTVGQLGQGGYGYSAPYLSDKIKEYLDKHGKEVAIIGFDDFVDYYDISGKTKNVSEMCYGKYIFEKDSSLIGDTYNSFTIRSIEELPAYLDELNAQHLFRDVDSEYNRTVIILKAGIIDIDKIDGMGGCRVLDFTQPREKQYIYEKEDPFIFFENLESVIQFMKEKKWIDSDKANELKNKNRDFSDKIVESYRDGNVSSPSGALKYAIKSYFSEGDDLLQRRNEITDEVLRYCLSNYPNPDAKIDVSACTTEIKYKKDNSAVPDYVIWCALSDLKNKATNADDYTGIERPEYLLSQFDNDTYIEFLKSQMCTHPMYYHELINKRQRIHINAKCHKYDYVDDSICKRFVRLNRELPTIYVHEILPEIISAIPGEEINDLIIDKTIWELDNHCDVEEFLFLNRSREALAYLCSNSSGIYKDMLQKYACINNTSIEELESDLNTPIATFELSKDEKIKKGIEIVAKLRELTNFADFNNEYNYYISKEGYTTFEISNKSDIQGAEEFLKQIACDENESGIFLNGLTNAVDKKGINWDIGISGVKTLAPIAVATAIHLFVDPMAKTNCCFARDKYEFRNDYDGVYTISFLMTPAFPDGWINVIMNNPKDIKCVM